MVTGFSGWLEKLGFMDFAGASVVHLTGGFIALAGIITAGRRRDTRDLPGQIYLLQFWEYLFSGLAGLALTAAV